MSVEMAEGDGGVQPAGEKRVIPDRGSEKTVRQTAANQSPAVETLIPHFPTSLVEVNVLNTN